MNNISEKLVGVWKVVSLVDSLSNGGVFHQFGEMPTGGIVYTPDGFMSLHLGRERPPTLADGYEKATIEEMKNLHESHVAMYGTYSIDEQDCVVTHHVIGSNWPSLNGTNQVRPFELEGDTLTLKPAPFEVNNVVHTRRLTLERVRDAAAKPNDRVDSRIETPLRETEGIKLENLTGKVALVTGGSSGIGRATALAFARSGAKVVVANRRHEAGEETVSMIRQIGGEATFVKTDVSKASEVEELVKVAVQTYGRLDCAVNNAGTDEGFGPRLADLTEQDFDYQIGVNLKGVWLCMKYELLQMAKQNSGAIVNMSSLNGLGGAAHASLYSTAKHGVMGLTKSAALEYAGQNIRINAIAAGAFDTPMLDRVFERASPGNPKKMEAIYSSMVAMRRIGKPEEVAQAVLWLCSDSSSYVTGTSMVVDGGLSARPF